MYIGHKDKYTGQTEKKTEDVALFMFSLLDIVNEMGSDCVFQHETTVPPKDHKANFAQLKNNRTCWRRMHLYTGFFAGGCFIISVKDGDRAPTDHHQGLMGLVLGFYTGTHYPYLDLN